MHDNELTRATDQRDRLALAIDHALRHLEAAEAHGGSADYRSIRLAMDTLRSAPQVILAEAVQVSEAHADAALLRHAIAESRFALADPTSTEHAVAGARAILEDALLSAPAGRRFLEAAYDAREVLEPLVLAAARREGRIVAQPIHLVALTDETLTLAVDAATGLPGRPRCFDIEFPESWAHDCALRIVHDLEAECDHDPTDEWIAMFEGELLSAFRRGAVFAATPPPLPAPGSAEELCAAAEQWFACLLPNQEHEWRSLGLINSANALARMKAAVAAVGGNRG